MQEKQILVTGSGFDLFHGLHTSCEDFIRASAACLNIAPAERTEVQVQMAALCQTNGFFKYFAANPPGENTWSTFEAELEKVIHVFINFLDTMKKEQEEPYFDAVRYSVSCEGFSFYELTVFKQFFNIFEQIYDDMSGGLFKLRQTCITPGRQLDAKKLLRILRRELNDFTTALSLYLSRDADPVKAAVTSPQIEAIHPDYVINFNYTDTARLYGISTEQIFYAKGRATLGAEHMVLGIPDESEAHLDFISFKNYFQSIIKFIGVPDRQQLHPVDESGQPVPVVTHVFGYSLPPSDESLILSLADASSRMIIYYTDLEDYAAKVVNLIKIFGKHTALEKIQTQEICFQDQSSFHTEPLEA